MITLFLISLVSLSFYLSFQFNCIANVGYHSLSLKSDSNVNSSMRFECKLRKTRVDLSRQLALNEWLGKQLKKQMITKQEESIVIFRPHEAGGLGNAIHGYFSAMLLVILYKTAFKGIIC